MSSQPHSHRIGLCWVWGSRAYTLTFPSPQHCELPALTGVGLKPARLGALLGACCLRRSRAGLSYPSLWARGVF